MRRVVYSTYISSMFLAILLIVKQEPPIYKFYKPQILVSGTDLGPLLLVYICVAKFTSFICQIGKKTGVYNYTFKFSGKTIRD